MKTKTKTILLISGALIMILVIVSFALVMYLKSSFPGTESVRVYIPGSYTDESVRDSLKTTLGDEFGQKVWHLWKAQKPGKGISGGSYIVEPGQSAISVARRIATGRQTPIKFTFNNIRLISTLSARLGRRLEADSAAFDAALDTVLPGEGFKGREQYPAAFLPDTYEFYWNAAPSEVIATMANVRVRFWTAARREKAQKLGLTPVQVATVASIVEEETAKKDERGKVARLYLNRIHRGMKLQADPTVKFALGDFSLRRIGGAMLKVNSPYNTYAVNGLPPGPIRIPEQSTLDAVLDAPEHDYVFMCAKSDFSGYHDFSTDYESHKANARKYQQELNKRNIRK